jgi:magnesium chelatase subunit D
MPFFPFSGIAGQELVCKALILNAINPRIGGVLLDGEKGTAKSTAVRSFGELLEMAVVNLPLNVSEDRLAGSLDIEQTIRGGKPAFSGGLLGKAHGGILYVDEVNLMSDHIVDILLDVQANKVNRIEREGISREEPCDFILIGTMNREEGELRPAFLDRFGLFVRVATVKDLDIRLEIVKNCMEYEDNPCLFRKKYKEIDRQCREKIEKSREMLPSIVFTGENRRKIVEICLAVGVDGHRADIVMRETARALAAWDGCGAVTDGNIDEAALFVLPHREKSPQERNQEEKKEWEQDRKNEVEPPENHQNDGKMGKNRVGGPDMEAEENGERNEGESGRQNTAPSKPKTAVFDIGSAFTVRSLAHSAGRKRRSGSGRRTRVNSAGKSGRYVHAAQERKNNDIALDATIRAASPFQKTRKKEGLAIVIHRADIREKVRQKKISGLIVFVVDASGSMGAGARMTETKSAVLSLLRDAYIKRDKVALIAFRGEKARLLMPPTGSVQRGYELLRDMETGGRTPLNNGLCRAYTIIKNETRKSPDLMPMLIIITDGRGNVPINAEFKPKQELLEIGGMIAKNRSIDSLVIDIEKEGFMKLGIARELSATLRGRYYRAGDLRQETILKAVSV